MILTDVQELAVINAAKPLQPQDRAKFLTELQARLEGRQELGDGELFRALREIQKKYFHPPPVGTWS